MIRNKNIAENAGIDPNKLAGGMSYHVPNNVRRVVQTANAEYWSKIIEMMPTGMVYTSVAAAADDCEEFDVIYVHAADAVYEPEVVINLDVFGVKLLGQLSSERQWGTPSLHVHTTDTVGVAVENHQIEIANVGFHQQTANQAITIAQGSSHWWRNHVHDCYFGGNSIGTNGINVGTVGTDAPCTIIENCFFMYWNTACIDFNCGYGSVIRNCSFTVIDAKTGVIFVPNGASRPVAEIVDNRFHALGSTSLGINIVNTPSSGYLMVDGNRFVGFASDAYCIDKRTDNHLGLNYNNEVVIASTT